MEAYNRTANDLKAQSIKDYLNRELFNYFLEDEEYKDVIQDYFKAIGMNNGVKLLEQIKKKTPKFADPRFEAINDSV
jgi:hypothetical protein